MAPKKKKTLQKKSQVVSKGSIVRQPPTQPQSAIGQGASYLGGLAGDLISRITGFGAYKVNRNSISDGNAIPSFVADGDGTVVCHREFLADITGSVAFALQSYDINPGIAQTFPWLSQVASLYEYHDFLGLVFEYRPTSGSAVSASSSALGTVVFATNYNVTDGNFATKQQAESYEFSTSTVPFNSMLHPVECQPRSNITNNLLVRNSLALASTENQQLYDLGNFQVITQGMQSAYIVGELWVTYHVRLSKPRIAPAPVGMYMHVIEQAINTASASHPMGTASLPVVTTDSNLLGVVPVNNTSIVVPYAGNYLVLATYVGSTFSDAGTMSLGNNMTALTTYFENSAAGYDSVSSSGKAAYWLAFTVKTTGFTSANYLIITGPTGMVTSESDITITVLPSFVN